MRDATLDVYLEVSKADLDLRQPKSGQVMLDKLRPAADEAVSKIPGARLMTDRFVDCRVSEGEHILTGEPMYLIASRWSVLVPDDARVPV